MEEAIDKLHPSTKEMALELLHQQDYDLEAFADEAASNLQPIDGSDWTAARRQTFHRELFRSRKDLQCVCANMDISLQTGLTYYLGHFKTSNDYRLTKTVCAEERVERLAASEHGMDACAICGDGGSLLICDGCEGEYHMECMNPPLKVVPEGHWECDECVDRKFLVARDTLLRQSEGLFATGYDDDADDEEEETAANGNEPEAKKQKANDEGDPQQSKSLCPSESVLDVVRKFAKTIHTTLQIVSTQQ